jgi:hypothetical protein
LLVTLATSNGLEPASMLNTGTPAFFAVSKPAATWAGSALRTIASTF